MCRRVALDMSVEYPRSRWTRWGTNEIRLWRYWSLSQEVVLTDIDVSQDCVVRVVCAFVVRGVRDAATGERKVVQVAADGGQRG